MTINEVPVDGAFQDQFGRCIEVQPVNITDEDGKDTGEPRLDRETGYPMWQVSVSVKREGRKPDLIHVKVPEPSAPDLEGKTPVFGSLLARPWSMLDFRGKAANGGLSWSATSVSATEDRPSSARKAAPPAPAAAEGKG